MLWQKVQFLKHIWKWSQFWLIDNYMAVSYIRSYNKHCKITTYQNLTEYSVHLPCGLSCDASDDTDDQTLSHTRDIGTISLHCEFYCVRQGQTTVQIVCYRQYIRTVSLPSDLSRAPSSLSGIGNTFHIQCTCICRCVRSCVTSSSADLSNYFHTLGMNTSYLQRALRCVWINCLQW